MTESILFDQLNRDGGITTLAKGEKITFDCPVHLALWRIIGGKHTIVAEVHGGDGPTYLSGPCTYSHLADHQ